MSTPAADSGAPPPIYTSQQDISPTSSLPDPLLQASIPSTQSLPTTSTHEIPLDPPLETSRPVSYRYPNSFPLLRTSVPLPTPTVAGSDQNHRLSYYQAPSLQSTGRLNPTNFVSLSRTSTSKRRFLSLSRTSAPIKGTFDVNPSLHIPTALLSPLSPTESETSRKNLKLEVQNGGIDVDIRLLGDMSMDEESHLKLRTTVDLRLCSSPNLDKFPLIARIHTPTLLRSPFHLTATAIDGYLSLHLPRSFRGLLTVKVNVGDLNNHIITSDGLSENMSILSETSTTRSYFVGELGGWSKNEQKWIGDMVDVTVNSGLARLQFMDEKGSDTFRRLCWRIGI